MNEKQKQLLQKNFNKVVEYVLVENNPPSYDFTRNIGRIRYMSTENGRKIVRDPLGVMLPTQLYSISFEGMYFSTGLLAPIYKLNQLEKANIGQEPSDELKEQLELVSKNHAKEFLLSKALSKIGMRFKEGLYLIEMLQDSHDTSAFNSKDESENGYNSLKYRQLMEDSFKEIARTLNLTYGV
jgi:hypothetical protein